MRKNTSIKKLGLPIGISILIYVIGYYFRIMHWPFGKELNFFGLFGILVFYIIRYFLKRNSTIKDTVKMIMVALWVILQVMFTLKKIPSYYLILGLEISVIFWILLELKDLFSANKNSKINPLIGVGMIIQLIFYSFKILHLPYQGAILIFVLFSFVLIAIGFIRERRLS